MTLVFPICLKNVFIASREGFRQESSKIIYPFFSTLSYKSCLETVSLFNNIKSLILLVLRNMRLRLSEEWKFLKYYTQKDLMCLLHILSEM